MHILHAALSLIVSHIPLAAAETELRLPRKAQPASAADFYQNSKDFYSDIRAYKCVSLIFWFYCALLIVHIAFIKGLGAGGSQ